MAGKSEKDKDKGDKKEKSQKIRKLLVILAVLFGLAGSSAGAYSFFNKPNVEAGKKKVYVVETQTMDLGELLVNLSGNGGIRYLKVKITLEYPKDKKIEEELKKKNHVMTDIIITTLRKKTLTEVYNADAVQELKDEIINEINDNLDYGDITGIYFTDFLVQ